jgi:TetR/AcrR family transcriptional regulator
MNLAVEKNLSRIQREKRGKIQKAALEVFSEYGLRSATLDKIASACGLTKPNILYYYSSKDQIYFEVLNGLLDEWVAPLHEISREGEPIDELLGYMRAKLKMSKQKPKESKLFANEILHGAPLMQNILATSLKQTLNEKVAVIDHWVNEGKLAPVNGYHLFFSIWAMTQHYADFDVQVKAVLNSNSNDHFEQAFEFLDNMYRATLSPN